MPATFLMSELEEDANGGLCNPFLTVLVVFELLKRIYYNGIYRVLQKKQ